MTRRPLPLRRPVRPALHRADPDEEDPDDADEPPRPWAFLHRHRDRLSGNHRVSRAVAGLDELAAMIGLRVFRPMAS